LWVSPLSWAFACRGSRSPPIFGPTASWSGAQNRFVPSQTVTQHLNSRGWSACAGQRPSATFCSSSQCWCEPRGLSQQQMQHRHAAQTV
jgi:hypothetical protein